MIDETGGERSEPQQTCKMTCASPKAAGSAIPTKAGHIPCHKTCHTRTSHLRHSVPATKNACWAHSAPPASAKLNECPLNAVYSCAPNGTAQLTCMNRASTSPLSSWNRPSSSDTFTWEHNTRGGSTPRHRTLRQCDACQHRHS